MFNGLWKNRHINGVFFTFIFTAWGAATMIRLLLAICSWWRNDNQSPEKP